jgi:hypothetical protein
MGSPKCDQSSIDSVKLTMNSTEQPALETIYVLAPQIVALGRALEPLSKAARHALRRTVQQSDQHFVVLDDLVRHMGVIEHALSGLGSRLDGLMADVIQNGEADALVVGRSVGRLEQVLWAFVDGYHDAKACHAGPESVEAQALILGVYRHHIESICTWLDELVTTLLSPEQALDLRGIKPSSDVTLNVSLNMTDPPEMSQIGSLVKSLLAQAEEAEAAQTFAGMSREAKPGILSTMGAMVFGLGVSGAIFGKKHD